MVSGYKTTIFILLLLLTPLSYAQEYGCPTCGTPTTIAITQELEKELLTAYLYYEEEGRRIGLENATIFVMRSDKNWSERDDFICRAITSKDDLSTPENESGKINYTFDPDVPGCVKYTFKYCAIPNYTSGRLLATCLWIIDPAGPDKVLPSISYYDISLCKSSPSPPPVPPLNYSSSIGETQYCNLEALLPPSVEFCWPIALILGLLFGAMYLSGRNPFAAFDFSAPRMKTTAAKWRAGGRSFYAPVQVYVATLDKVSKGKITKAKRAFGKKLGKLPVVRDIGRGLTKIGEKLKGGRVGLGEKAKGLEGFQARGGVLGSVGRAVGKIGLVRGAVGALGKVPGVKLAVKGLKAIPKGIAAEAAKVAVEEEKKRERVISGAGPQTLEAGGDLWRLLKVILPVFPSLKFETKKDGNILLMGVPGVGWKFKGVSIRFGALWKGLVGVLFGKGALRVEAWKELRSLLLTPYAGYTSKQATSDFLRRMAETFSPLSLLYRLDPILIGDVAMGMASAWSILSDGERARAQQQLEQVMVIMEEAHGIEPEYDKKERASIWKDKEGNEILRMKVDEKGNMLLYRKGEKEPCLTLTARDVKNMQHLCIDGAKGARVALEYGEVSEKAHKEAEEGLKEALPAFLRQISSKMPELKEELKSKREETEKLNAEIGTMEGEIEENRKTATEARLRAGILKGAAAEKELERAKAAEGRIGELTPKLIDSKVKRDAAEERVRYLELLPERMDKAIELAEKGKTMKAIEVLTTGPEVSYKDVKELSAEELHSLLEENANVRRMAAYARPPEEVKAFEVAYDKIKAGLKEEAIDVLKEVPLVKPLAEIEGFNLLALGSALRTKDVDALDAAINGNRWEKTEVGAAPSLTDSVGVEPFKAFNTRYANYATLKTQVATYSKMEEAFSSISKDFSSAIKQARSKKTYEEGVTKIASTILPEIQTSSVPINITTNSNNWFKAHQLYNDAVRMREEYKETENRRLIRDIKEREREAAELFAKLGNAPEMIDIIKERESKIATEEPFWLLNRLDDVNKESGINISEVFLKNARIQSDEGLYLATRKMNRLSELPVSEEELDLRRREALTDEEQKRLQKAYEEELDLTGATTLSFTSNVSNPLSENLNSLVTQSLKPKPLEPGEMPPTEAVTDFISTTYVKNKETFDHAADAIAYNVATLGRASNYFKGKKEEVEGYIEPTAEQKEELSRSEERAIAAERESSRIIDGVNFMFPLSTPSAKPIKGLEGLPPEGIERPPAA